MKRFVLIAVGAALIVGLGFVIDAQSRIQVDRPDGPPGPRLIYAPGRVEGATPEIELRPRLAGRIDEVLVREGQVVDEGEVLLRMDDDQYRLEVALSAAELAQANAQMERLVNGAHPQEIAEAAALWRAKSAELQRAQLAWTRVEALSKSNAVSQQTADDQRSLVTALTAEVEAARARLERLEAPARREEVHMEQARTQVAAARLELAKVQLDRSVLRAPIRGQILELHVEAGELAGPHSPQPALVMADTSRLRVQAFVEELDAVRVEVGMGCRISADGLPGRQLRGQVAELSPRMTQKELWTDRPAERLDTKTRQAWIELEPAPELVVGLRVDVTIDPGLHSPGSQEPPAPDRSEPLQTPRPNLEPLARTTAWEQP